MSQPRIEMNAVLLPNGRVLAIGGSVNDEDETTKSLNADIYNTEIADFTKVVRSSAGSITYARLYHEVALLLPDATVWLAGGNPTRGTFEQHVEIYKPAYLFNSDGSAASRPTISSAPGSIAWNGSFNISTPDAANISQVVLMRPGSDTHSFDMDQRAVGLSFTAGTGSLTVTAPPNSNIAPPGYYMLFIINNNGVPSVAPFVRLNGSASNPAPTVSSISPTSGTTSGGASVTITGTGFLSGATVKVGGTSATPIVVASSTSITAKTPSHSSGSASVVVTNTDSQTGTLSNGYTFLNPAPNVTAISPTSGATSGGTAVTITGTGFRSGASVKIGGTSATAVTVVSSTAITAITPVHSSGATSVEVTNSDGQSDTLTNGFTYSTSNPAPTISKVSPASGRTAGGTAVIITGTGFLSGASVKFGGASATGVTVVGSTSITATTPAHTAGTTSVIVTNSDSQSGTLTNGYTYANLAPKVTAIAPNSGATSGGTAVTITGSNFFSGASVNFGGTAAGGVNVVSSTSITASTPAHSSGTVNVVVANSDSQSGTLTNGYTYSSGSLGNPGLGLNVAPGWPGSLSLTAGQTGSYNLAIGGDGVGGTATLSCTGAPLGATCKLPATVAVSATVATDFDLTVSTTSRTISEVRPSGSSPMPWAWSIANWSVAALGLVLWPRSNNGSKRLGRRSLKLAPLALLLFTISCGGGGTIGGDTGGSQPNPNGTPAGTYTLTVTATSGTATSTMPLTLVVK
jgi:hypothetical protein